jgi:hypothetical protein
MVFTVVHFVGSEYYRQHIVKNTSKSLTSISRVFVPSGIKLTVNIGYGNNEKTKVMRVARGVLKKQGLVTAIFHDKGSASMAFDYLIDNGYDPSQIVVVMTQETYRSHYLGKVNQLSNGNGNGSQLMSKYLGKPGTSREVPSAGLLVSGPFANDPMLNNRLESTRQMLTATGIEPDRAIVYEPELRAGAVLIGVMPKGPTDRYTIGNRWRKSEAELILGDDEDF